MKMWYPFVVDSFENRYALLLNALVSRFGDELKTVVLFGSQARSKVLLPTRDHDLFVVTQRLPDHPWERMDIVHAMLLPLLADLPGTVHLVMQTQEEFESNIMPLTLEVSADGICLFGENYFEPWRKRALDIAKSAGLHRVQEGDRSVWTFGELKKNWSITWDGYHEHAG